MRSSGSDALHIARVRDRSEIRRPASFDLVLENKTISGERQMHLRCPSR